MPKIRLIEPAREHEPLREALASAFMETLDSGRYILGPSVNAFEASLVARYQARHALAVKSGTDALLLALMSLGVGPGDEVITTPFTFFATAGAIARLGARPVFVDITDDLLLDIDRALEAIGPKTRAIIAVHLFGEAQELRPLAQELRPRSIALIEDAAQAEGARSTSGTFAGAFGDFGCFSYFPTKNLGALGDGGALLIREANHYERARRLRAHGAHPKYTHHEVGGNFRMDELTAAVLRIKQSRMDERIEQRRAHAREYIERLGHLDPALLRLPAWTPSQSFNIFTLRTPRRDALKEALTAAGIESAIYYPLPLHLQPCFRELGYEPGSLPNAERAATEVLSIPVHPDLSPDERDYLIETILNFFSAADSAR